jgi:hypothetical protein
MPQEVLERIERVVSAISREDTRADDLRIVIGVIFAITAEDVPADQLAQAIIASLRKHGILRNRLH